MWEIVTAFIPKCYISLHSHQTSPGFSIPLVRKVICFFALVPELPYQFNFCFTYNVTIHFSSFLKSIQNFPLLAIFLNYLPMYSFPLPCSHYPRGELSRATAACRSFSHTEMYIIYIILYKHTLNRHHYTYVTVWVNQSGGSYFI